MKNKTIKYLVVIPSIIFFISSTHTLSDYGINWDEPFHFNRGQAYLRYILFGRTNYLDLPVYPTLKGSSDFMGREGEQDIYLDSKQSTIPADPAYRRSYFVSDVFNYGYLVNNDGYGHPAANGILASFTNYVFYEKLGFLGDIESYHFFEVIVSTLLVLGISVFVYFQFGLIPSFISSVSLAFYPLFFAESHFNIKDPVQASFFGLTIILFYFGVVKKRWRLITLSAISCGLALGTKFNIVFLPIIIVPWLLYYLYKNRKKKILNKTIAFALLTSPIVVVVIFYTLWPYLWVNPIERIVAMLKFYLDVGTSSTGETQDYVFRGFNLFPTFWILVTTPIPMLFVSMVGIMYSAKRFIRNKEHFYLLILLWFFIPIARVTLPGSAIHSGVRHILEFLPAMAILAGIGSYALLKYKKILIILITLSYIFMVYEVLRLHPNENIYMNQLTGGLSGAAEKNIPFWGYNYGNVYLQGVNWLNENAEKNATLGLPVVNMVNVPRVKLRNDIDFSNEHISGLSMNGEYAMEMSNNWSHKVVYAYQYYDKFLNPVHEVKVDGVALLKIWKNDKEHLKHIYQDYYEAEKEIKSVDIKDGIINIDLGETARLLRLQISHDSQDCKIQKGGYIRLSIDGKNWIQEPEGIDYPQIPVEWLGSDGNTFVYLFSDKPARYLFIDTQMDNSCIMNNPRVSVFIVK